MLFLNNTFLIIIKIQFYSTTISSANNHAGCPSPGWPFGHPFKTFALTRIYLAFCVENCREKSFMTDPFSSGEMVFFTVPKSVKFLPSSDTA